MGHLPTGPGLGIGLQSIVLEGINEQLEQTLTELLTHHPVSQRREQITNHLLDALLFTGGHISEHFEMLTLSDLTLALRTQAPDVSGDELMPLLGGT